jgi:hypothetical protein
MEALKDVNCMRRDPEGDRPAKLLLGFVQRGRLTGSGQALSKR